MDFRNRLEYLKSELGGILGAADLMEHALEGMDAAEFPERLRGLMEFRALGRRLNGIEEHCHSEDRIVESTFRHYLNGKEYSRVIAEHAELLRVLHDFREDLEFVTGDSTAAIVPLGRQLIGLIRAHIAFERNMLRRIEEAAPVPEEMLMRYTESPE